MRGKKLQQTMCTIGFFTLTVGLVCGLPGPGEGRGKTIPTTSIHAAYDPTSAEG